MKKRIFMVVLAMIIMSISVSFTGCDDNTSGKDDVSGGSTISAELTPIEELGEGFDSAYYPDKDSIKQYSGSVDVVLDFDENVNGWNAVAKEYERLQSGSVKININTTYSGSNYSTRLNQELLDFINTKWDIVEGNLGYGNTNTSCLSVKSFSSEYNAYCGKNVRWTDVLEDSAFKNVESGSDDSYIVNSETMQSCWFINNVAFNEAKKHGYEGDGYPTTWDELIDLCAAMKEAGYTNPLGISLSSGSIKSSQFSWLLRVYGDYYYRQYYQYITNAEEWTNYDETEKNVETLNGFTYNYDKIASIMRNESDEEHFRGVGSDIYNDFVGNLIKMKDYLMLNSATTEFNDARDQFMAQSNDKKSPQIFLDYLGEGIIASAKNNESFELGYFDYPTMESDYVDSDTTTRDIGGNGGFLSIVKHPTDANQTALNLDFLKFFLSPYGQTFYYNGLASNNVAPKGLSTVKNDLFQVPTAWTDFFDDASSVITFNGNVDGNVFLSWGVRYFYGLTETEGYIVEGWRNLLVNKSISQDKFTSDWWAKILIDYKEKCKESQWSENIYKNITWEIDFEN